MEVSPPRFAWGCVLGGWDTVLGGAGVRGMLEGNTPEMVTVPSWKWKIVREIIRG